MGVTETFGKYVETWSDSHPERARKLLQTGWEAQYLKLKIRPDRRLLPADQYVARLMMKSMLRPLKNPEKSAVVSVFTPCEPLHEAGLSPYSVEAFSCFLNASRAERGFLQQAENDGLSETLCSYHKTFIGAAEKGVLPKPACIVYTNLVCDANLLSFSRLEAFAETIGEEEFQGKGNQMGKGYFAGIDSGSTSTDVVILNKDREIVTGIVLPTGAGAAVGAERALEEALKEASLQREDIDMLVTTGYGRTAIQDGDRSITEITCHARGAHFLNPEVRTVVDIGGQDSKVIRLDENGAVENFVMNDKCAAGTGRFLEMMARTMEMDLDDMSQAGLSYKEDITISSMCTVFAESEVVSLIAQNKAVDDIVHGLNKAVATKTAALVKRVGGREKYMMTGGVSRNRGLVKTLEETLGAPLEISDKAQLCGALGAALFGADSMIQN